MSYYVYPDGTITEEPLSFMSDDYFIIQAEDYEEAYETALMMGGVMLQKKGDYLWGSISSLDSMIL